jgi:hypothetical protein
MYVICAGNNLYSLFNNSGAVVGELHYVDHTMQKGEIIAGKTLILENTGAGLWRSFATVSARKKVYAEMKVTTGSIITLKQTGIKQSFNFKRTGGWKLRFILLNKGKDELMAIIPKINWVKKGHDYKIQLNEEYGVQCTCLFILHALHCANCSLQMLNGNIPALLNI